MNVNMSLNLSSQLRMRVGGMVRKISTQYVIMLSGSKLGSVGRLSSVNF
jgi:hypothetical protein